MSDPFGDKRDPLVKAMDRTERERAATELAALRARNAELVAALMTARTCFRDDEAIAFLIDAALSAAGHGSGK